jgi:adenine-specific DNA-methyltransferase
MMPDVLESAEQARNVAQVALDARKSARERNQLGQFATPTRLALQMAELASEHLTSRCAIRFLDPGVGTGVFFYAACKVFGNRIKTAWGYESDTDVAETAQQLWGSLGLDVRLEDFCTALPPREDTRKANLILCNPPYVRHHHLSARQKSCLQKLVEKAGSCISGLAGLYCYFLILAHRWLSHDGVGVWVVPAEFLDVNYGKVIKEYLTTDVTLVRLHRFEPEDVQFTDALVSSIVVLFRMGKPSAQWQVQLSTGGSLFVPQFVRMIPLRQLVPTSKWGPLFTGAPVGGMRAADALTVGDLFNVKRGLATGANDFFILERRQADSLKLPRKYLRPILPGPREIPGAVIEANGDGFPSGVPELVLLDCDLSFDEIRKQIPTLSEYLELGKRQGIPVRYLPAHRRPWYSQEVRPPAPILCTYMGRQNGGRALRFLRNKSAATAPNVYLLLYPKPRLAAILKTDPTAIERVFEALTEVGASLVQGGRVYGGGLNKIEPKELKAVHLPPWLETQYPELAEFRLGITENSDIQD